MELFVWQPIFEKFEPVNIAYQYALVNDSNISQTQLGNLLGFSQATIGKWQQGICGPRSLSRNYYKDKIKQFTQARILLPRKANVDLKINN